MAVRNIFKYRRRNMVIFVAIIFSIFILVLAMGFIEGFKEMFNRMIFENIGHITIYKEGYYKKSEMLPIGLLIQKPDEIIVMTSNPYGGINAVELIISGFFKTGIKEEDENFIFMGLNKARNLLQIKDGVSEISLMLENDKLTSAPIRQ